MKLLFLTLGLAVFIISLQNQVQAQVGQNIELFGDDENCDTTKFPDYKRNLRFTNSAIELKISHKIDSLARVFYREMRAELPADEAEPGFLDTLILSSTSHYFSDAGVELFSFGYIVHSDNEDFETGEASFYFLGVKRKGEILFVDALHDIEGALTLQLAGFEFNETKDTATVWGKVEGLFLDEYGRFKLVVNNKMRMCLFECKN